MLSQQSWMTVREAIRQEVRQCLEEGRTVTPAQEAEAEAIEKIAVSAPAVAERRAAALSDALAAAPMRPGYPYREPDTLEEIKNLRDVHGLRALRPVAAEYDRVYGAWLGRCAGCLLGQPVEGWTRARIRGLLEDTGTYPLSAYIRSDVAPEIRLRWGVKDEGRVYGGNRINWINNVSGMPEDDDTNYTILALLLLETCGPDFTPGDAAETWLRCLPFLHVCTAERVAYRNLCNLVLPPLSALTRNPYREWIGAQIRGDLFGYVSPGDPERAAEFAWRDASISHSKNGIYGEMFVAAMLAAAAVTDDVPEIVRQGLAQIPHTSRLHESISGVLATYQEGESAQAALDSVFSRYDENVGHDWCHTVSNAMLVAIALLYGEKDFEKTVCLAVSAGFDTDCNGATAGSVLGCALGATALPRKWTAPLNDTVRSGVDGAGQTALSELAARTVALAPAAGRRDA